MPRSDLSTIDQTLRSLGPLPNDLKRLLEGQLGSARLDARRADELLAALEARVPHGTPQSEKRVVAALVDDEDEALLIDLDPDDD